MSSVADSLAAFFACVAVALLMIACLYGLIIVSRRWKKTMSDRVLLALRRRRKTADTFREENGYSWDYIMAFRVYDEEERITDLQMKYNMQFVLNQLLAGGMEFRLFYSLHHKEVYCKIRCSTRRMQKHADLIDYKLQLDQEKLRSMCAKGREGKWDGLKIPVNSDLTKLDPYEFIYAKYEFDPDSDSTAEEMAPLYKRWPRIELTEETEKQLSFEPTKEVPGQTNNPLASMLTIDTEGQSGARSESLMLRGVDRLKLIHMIISYGGPGGCGLDPAQMLKDECILGYSPLHDTVELRFLETKWLTFFAFPWKQPTDMIKNYFGEKIGLYFVWLGHYTTWLISAAVVGFAVWCNVASDGNNPNALLIPYFAGFMGMWSAMFLENWKRKEKTTAMEWGTVGFEEEEQARPQFKGEIIRSAVTGKPELYFSRQERAKRSFKSQWIILGLIFVVIVVISAIFTLRVIISKFDVTLASISSSLLIAIQIQVLNGYFGELAIKLNNYENHRTDTEYEDALIAKTFAFQFVNSFASLFYISFIKPFIQIYDPCVGGCMTELQTTLGTIFITRLAVGNFTELGVPMIQTFLATRDRNKVLDNTGDSGAERDNSRSIPSQDGVAMIDTSDSVRERERAKTEISEIERTFLMPTYDVMLGTFDDYAEMVIQFGYTTMFVAGFPLAPLMSLVNNYVEIRVDAWKLCQLCRRPEPRSCEDIGTWYYILEIISMSSIFINSGIVAFTAANTINFTWALRVWIFILMSSGLFCIRMGVAWIIPDEPAEVIIQLQRQEYIVNKVMFDVEDEDDTQLSKGLFSTPSYVVRITDDDPL